MTEVIASRLSTQGVSVVRISIAPMSLSRSVTQRLRRIPRIVRGLLRLLLFRHAERRVMYLSVSGGSGQIFELLFALIARQKRMEIFLHHHSFAYLMKRSNLTWLLARAAGPSAVHVVLSAHMGRLLSRVYAVAHVEQLSNAFAFTPLQSPPSPRRRLLTLGFLSNISEEKGVFDFLQLVAACRHAELGVSGILAGPFESPALRAIVLSGMDENVQYVGPQYGEQKDRFFGRIDVLVFPTRYVNEAEPLVIWEAMARGVPVIAYGRGAIPEMLSGGSGRVVAPAHPFVAAACSQIHEWYHSEEAFAQASVKASEQFAKIHKENNTRWQALTAKIAGRGR
jgi:glycosyltransferase involved in cell wall biosynthesis